MTRSLILTRSRNHLKPNQSLKEDLRHPTASPEESWDILEAIHHSWVSGYSIKDICGRVFWDPRSSFKRHVLAGEHMWSLQCPCLLAALAAWVTQNKASNNKWHPSFQVLELFGSLAAWAEADPSTPQPDRAPIVLPGPNLMASARVGIFSY